MTVHRSSIQQHLAESCVIPCGGIEATVALWRLVAWTELGARRHCLERTGVLVSGVGGHQPRALFLGRIERRVLHTERLEEPLLQEGVETHPTDYFDNAARCVNPALRVAPLCSRLVLHRRGEPDWHKVG